MEDLQIPEFWQKAIEGLMNSQTKASIAVNACYFDAWNCAWREYLQVMCYHHYNFSR
jgi:hypothetical protein